MIDVLQSSLLFSGLLFGLIHAFDADHVMAVSVMASKKPSLRQNVTYGARWALGHGGVLLLLGAIASFLGYQLPDVIVGYFEQAVGVLLIILGIWLWINLKQQSIEISMHKHGDITHTHLHHHHHNDQRNGHDARSAHAPTMVGVLHGCAGSAPVLALLPAMEQQQHWLALAYLALFSFGVLTSMVLFGFGLAHLQQHLQRWHQTMFEWSRRLLSLSAIGIGSYWLLANA
jgi:cytochrome c biogenesis protein CcdA